jgi:hypothetical protein
LDTKIKLMKRNAHWRALLVGAVVSGGLACARGEIGGLGIRHDPPSEGLLARWGLDANAGSKVADLSGNNRDGEVEGEAAWHPAGGAVRGALQLGNGSYVLFEGFDGPAENGQMSVATWLRSVSGPETIVPLLSTGELGWGLYYEPVAKEVLFAKTSSGSVKARADLSTDTWRHITAVDNGERLLLYVDGKLEASTAVEARRGGESKDLRLASNPDDPGVASTGLIDEVLVYDRALSSAEVESVSDIGPAPAPDRVAPELAIEAFTLRGQVENYSSDTRVTVNGTPVPVEPDGVWEMTLDAPDRPEEIVLTVSTSSGAHTEKRFQVEQGTLSAASESRRASSFRQDQP